MKPEMRRKLAREPFAEKIRKVAQLIRLAKTFPRRPRLAPGRKAGLFSLLRVAPVAFFRLRRMVRQRSYEPHPRLL